MENEMFRLRKRNEELEDQIAAGRHQIEMLTTMIGSKSGSSSGAGVATYMGSARR